VNERVPPASSQAVEDLCAPEGAGIPPPENDHAGFYQPRPLKKSGFTPYQIKDEIVLLPEHGDALYALNASSAAIWRLCNGQHSLAEIFTRLCESFRGDDLRIMTDLNAAVLQLRQLDLLEPESLTDPRTQHAGIINPAVTQSDRPRVRLVYGVEDRPYFHWQLAILFESLVGQMPAGWEAVVVVCNNHQPISPELAEIFQTYGVTYFTGESHADNHDMDFSGGGDRYVPVNRVEALRVLSRNSAPDDLICLMDTDIFLYGELQDDLFPRGNAMASNWIISQEKYFYFSTDDTRGLSLPKLLEALGYEQEFKPGGVAVFLTGESLRKNDGKLVQDCFRFLQILYLAGKILDLPHHGVWVAEMACFALAMYPNEIDYELLDIEQFAVQEQNADELPQGCFYHYYTDINDGGSGPFRNSGWHKQLFGQQNFLQADIESFLDSAEGAAERKFMQLAIQARDRIYGTEQG
jgi:hypothetical protein